MIGRSRTGRAVLLAALLTLAGQVEPGAQTHPQPPAQPPPRPAQIDRNGILILIRSALLAVQHGNETGNYTVLRDLAAPGFRDPNTAVRLGEIFASLRTQAIDLSGTAVLDPQLTLLPQIEGNGLLHMAGFFPSVPSQVNFELLFAPVDGRWRLFGISVNVGSAVPTAPQAEAAQPVARSPEPKREPKRAGPMKQAPSTSVSDKPVAPGSQP